MDTTEFLLRTRQLAQLPDNDEDWTDTQILQEAYDALLDRFAQPISALRNGGWLHRVQLSTTNGQAFYRIPPRSVVQGLEKLEMSSDNGASWWQLNVLTDSQATDYMSNNTNQPSWYAYESDGVILYPTPSGSFLVRFSYYLRPNQLIAVVDEGTVFAVGTTDITVVGDPGTLLADTTTMDVINTTGWNEVASVEMPYTAIAPLGFGLFQVTVPAGTDLTRVIAGQVVRVPDTTDQIPLPVELHSALVAYTAAVILVAKGDGEKAGQCSSKAESAIKRIVDACIPRNKSKPYSFQTKSTYLRRRIGGSGCGWR